MAELEKFQFDRIHLYTAYARGAAKKVARAKAMGVTDIVAMVNDHPRQGEGFTWKGGRESFVELHAACVEAGVAFALCSWLDPNAEYINTAARELGQFAADHPLRFTSFDLEAEWRFRTNNHVEVVADLVAPAFADHSGPICVTSFGTEPKEVKPFSLWAATFHAGAGMGQPYSVWQGKKWQESPLVQPDTFIGNSVKSWSSTFGMRQAPIAAVFDSPPPFRFVNGRRVDKPWTGREALQANFRNALASGVREIGLWWEPSLFQQKAIAQQRREVLEQQTSATGKDVLWGTGSLVKSAAWVVGGLAGAGALVYGGVKLAQWLRKMM